MAKEFDEVEYTKADLATWKQVLSYMKGERRDVILLFVSVITLAILDTIYPKLNGIVIDQYVLTGIIVLVAISADMLSNKKRV